MSQLVPIVLDTSPDTSGWFADASMILDLARDSEGLPRPTISPERVTFDFRKIVHAEDSRWAVCRAVDLLSTSLGIAFASRVTRQGSTMNLLLEAYLPSGLPVVLVARGEHFDGADLFADRLVAA